LSACTVNSEVSKTKTTDGFYVNIYQDEHDSNLLKLYFKTKNLNHCRDFKLNDFGKFKVISPEFKQSNPYQINLHVINPTSNEIVIKKDANIELILIYLEKKEEFTLTINENTLKIESKQESKFFSFQNTEINLIPEQSLTITFYHKVQDKLLEDLMNAGISPISLKKGEYHKFTIGDHFINSNYVFNNKRNTQQYIFCCKVDSNFNKINSVIQDFYNSNGNDFDYTFNFNIKNKIEFEDSGSKYKTVNISDVHLKSKYDVSNQKHDYSIHYEITKPEIVEITIFDNKGKLIQMVSNSHNLTGKYTFNWDGSLKNGQKAEKGIYFIQLVVNNKMQQRKMVILK